MMNRILYTVWFGPKMSKNRIKCLDTIVKNSCVDVCLITDENLQDYIDDNLHPKFYDLTRPQFKADYLRCYLMQNGGGYTDIKNISWNWNPYFKELEESTAEFIGYQEVSGGVSRYLPKSIRQKHERFIGCGHFLFKPNTEFATYWLNILHSYFDSIDVKHIPLGKVSGIMHEAMVSFDCKYLNTMPTVDMKNYR